MTNNRRSYAVLDMTHGGGFIAKKLASLGHDVKIADVYGTCNGITPTGPDFPGIRQITRDSSLPTGDTVIAPVHLDPGYPLCDRTVKAGNEILSHHEAVGLILRETGVLEGKEVFEITGSKGKTGTAFLLAAILSRKKRTVLHTSAGLYYLSPERKELIRRGLSIAPASILEATDSAANYPADAFVFEISLGGTGYADVGIITTLKPEYHIAAGKRNSTDAKLQMVRNAKPGSRLVVNAADESRTGPIPQDCRKYIFSTHGSYPAGVHVRVSGRELLLDTGDTSLPVRLKEGYDPASYATAFAASACAALVAGISKATIRDAFGNFTGVEGRMRTVTLEGRKLIDNSGSGTDTKSAEAALELALKPGHRKIALVIGEHAAQVCEGLPPEAVEKFVAGYGEKIDILILVGERMRDIGTDRAIYCGNLDEGIAHALALTSEKDTIVSCVKCFR
jgi:UDP-N-acetylmuramyl pentapeptide synthase